MDLKRMNLCFDVDDTRQKKAYDFLQYAGRKKTKTIVNMILKCTIPIFEETEEGRKDNKTNDSLELSKQIIKENYSSEKLDEIQAGITQIIETLSLMQKKSTIPQARAAESQKDLDCTDKAASTSSDEMNEEAFSLMMTLLP